MSFALFITFIITEHALSDYLLWANFNQGVHVKAECSVETLNGGAHLSYFVYPEDVLFIKMPYVTEFILFSIASIK